MQNRGPVKFATVVRDSEVEPKLSISVILIKRGFPTEKSLIVWQKQLLKNTFLLARLLLPRSHEKRRASCLGEFS